MTRREFIAAAAATELLTSKLLFAATPASSKTFPVHYARASAYDSLRRYVEPGTHSFTELKSGENSARIKNMAGVRLPFTQRLSTV